MTTTILQKYSTQEELNGMVFKRLDCEHVKRRQVKNEKTVTEDNNQLERIFCEKTEKNTISAKT